VKLIQKQIAKFELSKEKFKIVTNWLPICKFDVRRNNMRILHIIIGLIVFQVFISCKQKQSENVDKLVLLNSYIHDSIWETDTLYLVKSVRKDTVRFFYKQGSDTIGYSFFKSNYNDSSIYLGGLNCPLVSTKTFKINNKDFTVLKYSYDEENTIDEESSFFYQENYGLLVCFNDGWMDLIFSMEYDSISRILIDSIISDRTGFYLINVPQPPFDSLLIDIEQHFD